MKKFLTTAVIAFGAFTLAFGQTDDRSKGLVKLTDGKSREWKDRSGDFEEITSHTPLTPHTPLTSLSSLSSLASLGSLSSLGSMRSLRSLRSLRALRVIRFDHGDRFHSREIHDGNRAKGLKRINE